MHDVIWSHHAIQYHSDCMNEGCTGMCTRQFRDQFDLIWLVWLVGLVWLVWLVWNGMGWDGSIIILSSYYFIVSRQLKSYYSFEMMIWVLRD
jgi:hypothetical protein